MTTEIRVRTRIHPDTLAAMRGKVLAESDLDVMLMGQTAVKTPDGKLMALYLPGYFPSRYIEPFYPTLHALRGLETDNRGDASGTGRAMKLDPHDGSKARTRTQPVPSALVGAFEANPGRQYCRLTAWTGRETERFRGLWPLFEEIGNAFAKNVPDRYQSQMAYVARTPDDWVVPGTPFTTITVNNSYPTGVHTDAGDLEEGFSNLTVLRRGSYHGGIFTFPEYRVGVDMKDGDLLLMDAHQWHGNTAMFCDSCGDRIGPPNKRDHHDGCGDRFDPSQPDPERISIVCYYRTKMADCGTAEEEAARSVAAVERRIANGMSAVDEMAEEAAR